MAAAVAVVAAEVSEEAAAVVLEEEAAAVTETESSPITRFTSPASPPTSLKKTWLNFSAPSA